MTEVFKGVQSFMRSRRASVFAPLVPLAVAAGIAGCTTPAEGYYYYPPASPLKELAVPVLIHPAREQNQFCARLIETLVMFIEGDFHGTAKMPRPPDLELHGFTPDGLAAYSIHPVEPLRTGYKFMMVIANNPAAAPWQIQAIAERPGLLMPDTPGCAAVAEIDKDNKAAYQPIIYVIPSAGYQ